MIRKIKIMSIILCAPLLAGCATMAKEATATSHSFVAKSAAGAHLGIQMTMHTGVPNTPQQTVMLVYNEHNKNPIAIVEGQTKPMSEELMAQFISILGGATSAAITGNYVLQAAQANCPPGTLCGTLVQVQNTAGASADAAADSSSD